MGRYGTVGIELIVSMGIGYYGGRWVDGKLDAHGWLTGGGAFLGVVLGFYSLWKASRAMTDDAIRAERQEREEREGR